MSDGTATPATPSVVGKDEAYALNLKSMIEESTKDLAELRDKYEQLGLQTLANLNQMALKTLSDAQSAANTHLLNVIDSADKISKSTIVHLATVAANEEEEQETDFDITADDINKISQAVTAAITAVLANMATGRPPVNQSGTTETAVAK
jgi:hypothetical protein